MAISMNGGNGYGSRRRGGVSTLSEINVTPFVDVVLVLLIIFMLTAHVMDFGLEVEVPKVRPVKESVQDYPVVTITKKGDVYLNGQPVTLDGLKPAIQAKFGKAKGVFVAADAQTIWDPIMQVTATLGEAGFQINMVTQPEDTTGKGRRR
jgi:biopolymer transport protein ExbD